MLEQINGQTKKWEEHWIKKWPWTDFSELPLLYLRNVKVNDFIYRDVLKNVDILMDIIKERGLSYKEIIKQVKISKSAYYKIIKCLK